MATPVKSPPDVYVLFSQMIDLYEESASYEGSYLLARYIHDSDAFDELGVGDKIMVLNCWASGMGDLRYGDSGLAIYGRALTLLSDDHPSVSKERMDVIRRYWLPQLQACQAVVRNTRPHDMLRAEPEYTNKEECLRKAMQHYGRCKSAQKAMLEVSDSDDESDDSEATDDDESAEVAEDVPRTANAASPGEAYPDSTERSLSHEGQGGESLNEAVHHNPSM